MLYKFIRWLNINCMFPIYEIIGRIIPSTRVCLEKSFVYLNNRCVENYKVKSDPRVLVLLPHCLQFDECVHRITKDVENCKGCGKCVIKDFSDFKQKNSIPVKIATGGTIARRIVKEIMPDLIIACACERDLSSGIYDSYPFVVWGICNEKPNGPCVNTTVDFQKIHEAIEKFCGNGKD